LPAGTYAIGLRAIIGRRYAEATTVLMMTTGD